MHGEAASCLWYLTVELMCARRSVAGHFCVSTHCFAGVSSHHAFLINRWIAPVASHSSMASRTHNRWNPPAVSSSAAGKPHAVASQSSIACRTHNRWNSPAVSFVRRRWKAPVAPPRLHCLLDFVDCWNPPAVFFIPCRLPLECSSFSSKLRCSWDTLRRLDPASCLLHPWVTSVLLKRQYSLIIVKMWKKL